MEYVCKSWPEQSGGISQEWPCGISTLTISRVITWTRSMTVNGSGNCQGQSIKIYETLSRQSTATATRASGALVGTFRARFGAASDVFPRPAERLAEGAFPPILGWEWGALAVGAYTSTKTTDSAQCVETSPGVWELQKTTRTTYPQGQEYESFSALTPRLWFAGSWKLVFTTYRMKPEDRNYPYLDNSWNVDHIADGLTCSLDLLPDDSLAVNGWNLDSYSETFTVQFS